MEVLCNGRVGDFLEAGLVLTNVANLCRYTYLEGTHLAAVDK